MASEPPAEPRTTNTLLIAVHRPLPEIPKGVLRVITTDEVVIDFGVDEDGTVVFAEVRPHKNNPRLDQYLLKAVLSWRFQPLAEAKQATVPFSFD